MVQYPVLSGLAFKVSHSSLDQLSQVTKHSIFHLAEPVFYITPSLQTLSTNNKWSMYMLIISLNTFYGKSSELQYFEVLWI